MKITEVNISEILKELGKEKRIFQREAQFQFELAWKLHEKIGGDGEVRLEVLSCTKNKSEDRKAKRFYSDIILKDDSGFIVIELKYKTKKETESTYGVELIGQGAQDEGRYDYLWDIKRIELLKNRNEEEYTYPEIGEFLGGYAIMLTNDNQYWERTKEYIKEHTKKEVSYLHFCIGGGDTVEGKVDWNTEEERDYRKSRPPITFDKSYAFEWQSYCVGKGNHGKKKREFRYLITHIE